MIEVKKMAAQGDVLFRRIAALPADIAEQKTEGAVVVAHSETGHNHEIAFGEARLFEKLERDTLVCFLAIDGEFADVVHKRSFHTHETIRLLGGLWEVRRQREHTPEGWRRVAD